MQEAGAKRDSSGILDKTSSLHLIPVFPVALWRAKANKQFAQFIQGENALDFCRLAVVVLHHLISRLSGVQLLFLAFIHASIMPYTYIWW